MAPQHPALSLPPSSRPPPQKVFSPQSFTLLDVVDAGAPNSPEAHARAWSGHERSWRETPTPRPRLPSAPPHRSIEPPFLTAVAGVSAVKRGRGSKTSKLFRSLPSMNCHCNLRCPTLKCWVISAMEISISRFTLKAPFSKK